MKITMIFSRYKNNNIFIMAHSSSGLRHRTVTAEITGSNPVWVVYIYGVLVKRFNTPDFLSGIRGFESHIRHLLWFFGVKVNTPVIYRRSRVRFSSEPTVFDAEWSNGMTLEFGSSNRGSIPCSAVKFIL